MHDDAELHVDQVVVGAKFVSPSDPAAQWTGEPPKSE